VLGGPYAITQGTLTNANNSNYSLTYDGSTFSITARPVTVTADAGQTKVYGDADPASYTFTTTSLGTGTALSGSLTRAAGETVLGGPYAITQGTLTDANNSNYSLTYDGSTFAITPRPVTVTAAAGQTKVYGSADPAAYTFTNTSLGTGIALSGLLARAAGTTVSGGPYAITQGTLTNANNSNYNLTYVGATFSITPATLTYLATAANWNVGANNASLGGTVTGFVGGESQATATTGTLSFGTSATSSSAAGAYAITGSGLTANNGDYVFVQAAANSSALTLALPSTVSTAPTVVVDGTDMAVPTVDSQSPITQDLAVVVLGDRYVLIPIENRVSTGSSLDNTLNVTLGDVTSLPRFGNSASATVATSGAETAGTSGAAGSLPGPGLSGYQVVATLEGSTSGADQAGAGALSNPDLNDAGLYRESAVSMGKFNVIYHEVVDQARQRARDNTAASSSYTEFLDSEKPQVLLLRVAPGQKPSAPPPDGPHGGSKST